MAAPRLNEGWLNTNVQFDKTIKAGDEILAIAQELKDQTPRCTLDEYKFVNVFLPLFAGTPEEELKYKVDLNSWVKLACNNSRYNEVDIVDNQDLKKVLFTVPPLLDRMATQPTHPLPGSGGVYNMLINFKRLQSARPAQAEGYLNQEMSRRVNDMAGPEDNILKYLRIWNDIFKRYGYPPILELAGETSPHTEGKDDAGSTSVKQQLDDADWELL